MARPTSRLASWPPLFYYFHMDLHHFRHHRGVASDQPTGQLPTQFFLFSQGFTPRHQGSRYHFRHQRVVATDWADRPSGHPLDRFVLYLFRICSGFVPDFSPLLGGRGRSRAKRVCPLPWREPRNIALACWLAGQLDNNRDRLARPNIWPPA